MLQGYVLSLWCLTDCLLVDIWMGMQWNSIVAFICISLMTEVEYLLMCLLTVCDFFFLRNDLFLLWCWIMCASLIDFFKFLLYSILFQFTIHLFIVFEAYFTNFSVLIIFAMKSNLCFLGTGWLHCLTCPILSAWFESQLFRFQCNILVVCTLSSSGW